MVFGGDFQQILPVMVKGSRPEIVNASIWSSYIWPQLKVLSLKINMRLGQIPEEVGFAKCSWMWAMDDTLMRMETSISLPTLPVPGTLLNH
jgi:hypothetical protein